MQPALMLLREGDDLATRYLYMLSNDAGPVLADGPHEAEGQARVAIIEDLQIRLNTLEADTQWRNWQAFHLSNWEAYTRLKDLQGSGLLCCNSAALVSPRSRNPLFGMAPN